MVLLAAILFGLQLFSGSAFAQEPPVRVAILQNVASVRVTVFAPCRLMDPATGAVIQEYKDLLWQEVKADDSGVKIGQLQIHSQAVALEPTKDTIVRVNARPYRGSLIFYRTSSGKLTVVNRVDLEEYLVGALASEAGSDWPIEALKAHAIVSRTMVAHRIWIQKGQPFDVTADTQTHLYYGAGAEREGTRVAVERTRGRVLAYPIVGKGMELLPATFHANCGGHTEDAAELWEGTGDLKPLKGVPDSYCKDLKHFRWSTNVPMTDFLKALGAVSQEIGKPVSCEVQERNSSGRVRVVRLTGSEGSLTVSGRRFRELLGSNRLRSLNFTATVSPQGVSFSGFGWGHGVGLCQWGAYGMAIKGKTAEEILGFYFPGAQRRKLTGLPGFPRGTQS